MRDVTERRAEGAAGRKLFTWIRKSAWMLFNLYKQKKVTYVVKKQTFIVSLICADL